MAAVLLLVAAAGVFAHDMPDGGADSVPELDLTAEERAWLAVHPVLRLGVDPDFAPYEFTDPTGSYAGIGASYVQLLSRRLGIEFRVVPGLSWQQAMQKARNKELDLLAALVKTPGRTRFLKFTRPYAKFPFVIITRKDHPAVDCVTDLTGKRVALVKEYAATELTLLHNPGIEPLYVDNIEQSLQAVAFGRADATVGDLATVDHALQVDVLANLKVAVETEYKSQGLRMGVRDDWPILASILDKALATVTPEEHSAIRGHWIGVQRDREGKGQPRVELTEEEREWMVLYRRWMPLDERSLVPNPTEVTLTAEEEQWLQAHPWIRVGYDPFGAPLGFADRSGAFAGISADYLEEVGKLLGIRFEMEASPSRKGVMQRVVAGELDLVPGIRKTPERAEHLEFTQPYLSSPIVIYAGPDLPYVGDLRELSGEQVLVVEQHATAELLRLHYPQIELITAANVSEALLRLSRGEAKAFVGNLLTSGYYIGQFELSNLKVVGQTPYSFDLAMAVRGDWPVLAGLLRRALDTIPEERRNAIYRDWIAVRYERGLDYALFWQLLAGVVIGFLAILLWNRVLMNRVAARTQQFQDELLRRRQSEERFRLLYEHSPLPYQSLDAQGRFVAVNRAFEETLGYLREEVIGRPFFELVLAEDQALFHREFEKFMERGQVHAGPRLQRKDGTWIHAELAGVIARGKDGQFLQTHCVWEDVTERMHAEQALRDQRDFLESIFNKVDYAVFVLEVIDGGEYRYLVTNQRHQEWRKLAPEEINGKTPAELIPHVSAEVAAALQENYRACAQSGESIQYEELVPIKNKEIWWSTRLTPLKDSEGRVCRIIGTTTDITQRRLAERWLQEHQGQLEESVRERTAELELEIARRKEIETELLAEKYKAEAANIAKSMFLANMSHELRTPLNAVLGYARILQKRPDVSTRQMEGLQVIERGGRHLHTLINDILDIARIEAGRLVLEPVPMRLGRFLRELAAIVRTRAEEKGIEVVLFTDPGLPSSVLADEKRLRQILLNLLGNAVKFTDEGRVSLSVSTIEQESTEDVCRLIFEVKDTGIGIASDQLERIFQPFEQAGQTCHEEGTGLGLAISKHLVNKMGGC